VNVLKFITDGMSRQDVVGGTNEVVDEDAARIVSLADAVSQSRGVTRKRSRIGRTADPPVLHDDRLPLGEMMRKPLENAVKCAGSQTQPRIEIESRLYDNGTICYVRGTGSGTDSCYHERIFRFVDQLNQGIEGSGHGSTLRFARPRDQTPLVAETQGHAKGPRHTAR